MCISLWPCISFANSSLNVNVLKRKVLLFFQDIPLFFSLLSGKNKNPFSVTLKLVADLLYSRNDVFWRIRHRALRYHIIGNNLKKPDLLFYKILSVKYNIGQTNLQNSNAAERYIFFKYNILGSLRRELKATVY